MNLNPDRRFTGRFRDRKMRSYTCVFEQLAYQVERALFFAQKPVAIVVEHSCAQINCLALSKGAFGNGAVVRAAEQVSEQRSWKFPAMLIEHSGLTVGDQHSSLLNKPEHGICFRL